MGQVVSNTIAEIKMNSRWSSGSSAPMDDHSAVFTISGIPAGATDVSATLWYTIKITAATGTRYLRFNGVDGYHREGTSSVSLGALGNGTHTVTIEFQPYGGSGYTQSVLMLYDVHIVVSYTEPASSWTIPSSVALNGALGLSITSSVSGRRHTWNVSFGGASMGWQEISGTSASYTLPLSWASQIPNATSGTGTVHFRTCDSSLNVLSETSRSITVTLPSSVVPSAGSLSVAVNNPYVYNSVQYCLQGIHTLTLTLSGDAGAYGSTIRSVFISGGGYSGNGRALTTNPIQQSGNITFTATVTDSRGRSASASVSRYVQPYAPVSIASAVARRADGNYVASDNGTNLYGSVTFVKTEVPGAGVTVMTDYKTSTASAYASLTSSSFAYNDAARSYEIRQAGLLATDASYNIRYTVTDGITTTVYEMIVPTASVYAVYDKDAKTVGFGAYPDTRSATNNFTVASDWNLYTHGSEILELIRNQAASVDAAAGFLNTTQVSNAIATALFNCVYPVGSIYVSTNSTSPASFLGGTWQRLYDRMLVGGGNTYACGATGGEASHVLSVDEMPSHTHNYRIYASAGTSTQWCFDNVSKTAISDTGYIGYAGGSQAHNNMPPYLAVYMWQRTA